MNKEEELQYIGQKLLERGFTDWFRYMFYAVRETKFVVEPIHPEIFKLFEDIYNGKTNRVNLNIPPRSAKTTMAEFFIAYAYTINPKCNFIYTSYSQSLLTTIASEVADILESPIYKAMYPHNAINIQQEEANPIDDFWGDYLKNETKGNKNTYTSRKIITYAGGICLFASIGAQITGMGCGLRTAKSFSGALIMDDANKPADIRSQLMREKVARYYEETLLSRLNNPHVPIINIQQRLHIQDLSGILEEKYNFKTIRRPLLDENGICQIPSQYTQQRLEELQKNNYMFSAQYQQQPIILGGEVIKSAWFNYYPTNCKYSYKRLIITADTAMKVKEHNDYSCFIVGAVTEDNKLHILDIVHGKWEAPDLKRIAVELFEKWKYDESTGLTCSGLYVEDKASGIGLIQELKRLGIPVIGLLSDKDKLTRVENVLSYIESGQVFLPNDINYGNNKKLLDECEQFTRDDSHMHDDMIDALVYCIQEALAKTKVSLLDYFLEN